MKPVKQIAEDRVDVNLNVLGYREDNEWTALALEMDLEKITGSDRANSLIR